MENRLLKALSEIECSRLLSNSTEVHLKRRTILYHSGDKVEYCYFPLSGMISLLSTTANEKSVIIGVTGNEGIVGVAALLPAASAPYEIMAQIPVNALRVKASVVRKEFKQSERFQQLVMNYLHRLLLQISQSAMCHSFHTVEQRLACWLLISSDCLHSDELSLTQQCISNMLGTPRTNITMIANALQEKGLIYYNRGIITIVDPEALEQTSCECYRILKNQIDEFYQ
jgi:CRP-like cAMP-binding protein